MRLFWRIFTVYGKKKRSMWGRWGGAGEKFRKIRKLSGVSSPCPIWALDTVMIGLWMLSMSLYAGQLWNLSFSYHLPSFPPKLFIRPQPCSQAFPPEKCLPSMWRRGREKEKVTRKKPSLGSVLNLTLHSYYSPRNPQFSGCTANMHTLRRRVREGRAFLCLCLYYRKIESWRDSAIYERKSICYQYSSTLRIKTQTFLTFIVVIFSLQLR